MAGKHDLVKASHFRAVVFTSTTNWGPRGRTWTRDAQRRMSTPFVATAMPPDGSRILYPSTVYTTCWPV